MPDCPAPEEYRDQPVAGSPRILWIDDQIQQDDPIVLLLRLDGFRIDIAGSGMEGLKRASSGTFDAILLDLKLDDMYGLTVLQRLAAHGNYVPVMVVTGCYGQPEVEADALRAGAVAFRHKPLVWEELASTLREIVGAGPGDATRVPGEPLATNATVQGPNELYAADPRVNQVLRIVRDEIADGSSLHDLADRVGLSASRLRHLVRATLHIPLARFRKDLRLETAAVWLVSTHKRISQIARDVGMDPAYFDKAFHRRYGASPRAYRTRHHRT